MTMKKIIPLLFAVLLFTSCEWLVTGKSAVKTPSEPIKVEIGSIIDQWHKAAAKAEFDTYFSFMAPDAVFIGTDASENWKVPAFKKYAKPHFEKGKAWAFSTLDRTIYLSDNGKIAWFDELLKTQMGLCSGSGVMTLINGEWKIKHYVLSMTIPNTTAKEVTRIKRDFDRDYVDKLSEIRK